MNSQQEPTDEDIEQIMEQLGTLKQEVEEYEYLLIEYKNDETDLESVTDWIASTEYLFKL